MPNEYDIIQRPVKFIEREGLITDAKGQGVIEIIGVFGMSFASIRERAEEIVQAINEMPSSKRRQKVIPVPDLTETSTPEATAPSDSKPKKTLGTIIMNGVRLVIPIKKK